MRIFQARTRDVRRGSTSSGLDLVRRGARARPLAPLLPLCAACHKRPTRGSTQERVHAVHSESESLNRIHAHCGLDRPGLRDPLALGTMNIARLSRFGSHCRSCLPRTAILESVSHSVCLGVVGRCQK